MSVKISTGLQIAERANKELGYFATRNDVIKQEEMDKKAETHRTVFRRERDRILYSGGFRRLQDKTQVMAAVKTGDHRTRLTHSLEVEQIAISIADALNLNKDLTSAIALGHDIGHTPFGHAVERFLDSKLIDEGGFSHALESVRYLKKRDVDVSDEIIEGILKHDTDVFVHKFEGSGQLKPEDSYYINEPPGTLEAQIVYWADKIAYITHDYEDFMKSKILQKTIDDGKLKQEELEEVLSELLGGKIKLIGDQTKNLTRDLVRNITKDLIESSKGNINKCLKKDDLKKYSDGDRKRKQEYIRENTMERIKRHLDGNEEYRFLKDLRTDGRSDKEIDIELGKANKFYCNREDEKMLIKIVNLQSDIREKIDLEREIKGMSNMKMLKEQKKIIRYKELDELRVDILVKRINQIKMESYQAGLIINLCDDYRKKYLKLRGIIDDHYIGSPEVQLSDAKAERIVSSLFDMYYDNIKILPNEIKDRINEDKLLEDNGGGNERIKLESIYRRNIASYIASMSDIYAELIYKDLNSTGSHYGY